MKSSSRTANVVDDHPLVLNALIRCRRDDSKAALIFERIDEVPGLWVLELGPNGEESWPGWLSETHQLLAENEPFFKGLREGSTDYTLHVTVAMSELRPVIVPPLLAHILGVCGITLELYQGEQ